MGFGDFVIDQRHDIFVEHFFFAVGERLETVKGVIQRVVAELVAKLQQFAVERVAARQFAELKRGFASSPTDCGVMIS